MGADALTAPDQVIPRPTKIVVSAPQWTHHIPERIAQTMIVAFCNVAAHLVCAIGAFRLPRLRGQAVRVWEASESRLLGIAVSNDDSVFLIGNCRVLVFSAGGVLLRQWGSPGSAAGQLYYPTCIAVASGGEVVVADCDNHRVQVFRADGTLVRMWGSEGSGDGQFKNPHGVAVTAGGEVVVTESGNHRVQVFRLSDGAFQRQWGGYGSADGQFNYPAGVCVTTHGEVFVGGSYISFEAYHAGADR